MDRISRLPLGDQPSAWGSVDKDVMTRYYPGVIRGHPTAQFLHGANIGGMNVDQVIGMPTWKDIYVR